MKLWRVGAEALRAPLRERALVLAPHADDELLGCGGTILLHLAQGDPVRVVVIFDGHSGLSAEWPRDTRRREALRVSQLLGLEPYHFLEHPEGHVPSPSEFEQGVRQLAGLIEAWRPEVVYAPWPGEAHLDHRTLARAASRAVQTLGCPAEVWGYEVWTPLRADRVIEISQVWERKLAALAEYRSQLGSTSLALQAEQRARARAALFPEGSSRSEAFMRFPRVPH